MALEIDGFAVLGAIARSPDVFPAAKPDAVKTAKGFVVKQIKDKSLTAAALEGIATAIGSESFDLIADSLSDADIKAIIGKIDKLNTAIKGQSAQDQRRHVADLAYGRVAPAVKAAAPAKPAKAPPKGKAEELTRSGDGRAAKARRKAAP